MNNGSCGKHSNFHSQNRVPMKQDFNYVVRSEYVNALHLTKEDNPDLDESTFEKELCQTKINELLDKARYDFLFSPERPRYPSYIAKAWIWAKRIDVNITKQVRDVYSQEGTLFASAEVTVMRV